jgi:hypothetical protein
MLDNKPVNTLDVSRSGKVGKKLPDLNGQQPSGSLSGTFLDFSFTPALWPGDVGAIKSK